MINAFQTRLIGGFFYLTNIKKFSYDYYITKINLSTFINKKHLTKNA